MGTFHSWTNHSLIGLTKRALPQITRQSKINEGKQQRKEQNV